MDQTYEIIHYLLEHNRNDIYLRFNTNLNNLKYKNMDILSLLANFDRVHIAVSIDDFEPNRIEYVRYGLKYYERFEQNMFDLIESGIDYSYSPVMSLYNIMCLDEILNRFDSVVIDIDNILTDPKHLSIRNLSQKNKEMVSNKLDNDVIINHMMQDPIAPYSEFLDWNYRLDKIRGTDFNTVFPELV